MSAKNLCLHCCCPAFFLSLPPAKHVDLRVPCVCWSSLLFLDFVPVPWSRPIEAARRAHNGAHEFAECDVQLANVLFLVFATATCKTSNWCNHLLDFALESICSIPIVTKEATHLGLSNPNFLLIPKLGAVAGGSEMPP